MDGKRIDAQLANRAAKLTLSDGLTLLEKGAFGKVFKETRRANNKSRVCAVKKIRNFDQAAVNEVETLMKLDHNRIIKCYSHHLEDKGQTLCIVMEYADKRT